MIILFIALIILEIFGFYFVYQDTKDSDSTIDPTLSPEGALVYFVVCLFFGPFYAVWRLYELLWKYTLKKKEE